jgi:hypothetical protein
MPPVGLEPTNSAGERPQTYALDCAATGTGTGKSLLLLIIHCYNLRNGLKLFCETAILYLIVLMGFVR